MSTRAAACGAVFPSPLGWCAVLWQREALQRILIALPDRAAARRALAARPGAPWRCAPHGVAELLARYLHGERVHFPQALPLPPGTAFQRRVWAAARKIPWGAWTTYAALLDRPALARAVGAALGRNPLPIVIPCHRVLRADGGLGGFSATGGPATKARLLLLEGHDFSAKSS